MSKHINPHQAADADDTTTLEHITRGLARIDSDALDLIRATLKEGRSPSVFWGTAPSGRPHIGYLVPFVKLTELVEAGSEVTVLLADLYTFLVNYKHPRSVVTQRKHYYRHALSALFESILGRPASNGLRFVEESSYALSEKFILDFYQMLALTANADARAPSEELTNTPMLSPLVTPIIQALDEEYTDCDLQLGGLDQVGLFAFSEKSLAKLGYTKKRAHMMNPMLPGLRGKKMSASDPDSKIDLLDTPEVVRQKISAAACDPRMVVEDNPILALLRIVLIPISKLRSTARPAGSSIAICVCPPFVEAGAPHGTVYSVQAEGEDDGFRHYTSYEEIEAEFLQGMVTPQALKEAVARSLNQLLVHVRNSFETNPEWKDAMEKGYPAIVEDSTAPVVTRVASEAFCFPSALREISNDRVKLIPFNSSMHAEEFIRLAKVHPEVWTHIPFGPFPSTQSFITEFIEHFVRPNTGMCLYTVIDKTKPSTSVDPDGAFAGVLSYINTSKVNLVTELGFVMIFPEFQRTHVTSNACGLLLDYAFTPQSEGGLALRRVQWQTNSRNHASVRAAERMGFVKEGVLRWDRVIPGGRTAGKEWNGRSLRLKDGAESHFNEDDVGRDTVMLSLCWDDWFLEGKKENLTRRMAGVGLSSQ